MAGRYRRQRTQEQRYALKDKIMRSYRRFFPRGTPALFYAEWEGRRSLGRFGPDRQDKERQGYLLHNHVPRPPKAANNCAACGRRFWYYPSQGLYQFCGTRCREAARLSALYTAFPDYSTFKSAPVTTALRLWCYTHDSFDRPPSALAHLVIASPEELMSTDLNTYYDEKRPLTTAQQDALRDRIDALVTRQMVRANAQLSGNAKKPWSQQQVRLFLGLLNKVIPDITAQMILSRRETDAPPSLDPRNMSRQQLEQALAEELARTQPRQSPPKIIDAETLEERK